LAVSPGIAKLVSKIPFQLAEDYSKEHIGWDGEGTTQPVRRCNREVYRRLSNLLRELFGPLMNPEVAPMEPDRNGKLRLMGAWFAINVDALDEAVELHLRMIASRQKFEWRWKGTTAD